jgi:hypothetical protein
MLRFALFFIATCACFAQFEAEKWIRSDAARLSPIVQRHLLDKICPGHATDTGCDVCPPDTSFGPLVGGMQTWRVKAITFGHFLTPSSQDALVSGEGCEPQTAGTTDSFLLSKEGSYWRRIRNAAGLNAWDCKKLAGSDGRDRLVCGSKAENQGDAASYLSLLDPGVVQAEEQTSAWDFFAVGDTTDQLGIITEVERGAIERVDFVKLANPSRVRIIVLARLGKVTLPYEVAEKLSVDLDAKLRIAIVPRRYEFVFDGAQGRPSRNNPPMQGNAAVAPHTSYSVGRR